MPQSGPRSGDEVKPEIWKTLRQIQDWVSATSPDYTVTVSADHQMFTVDHEAIRGDMLRGIKYNSVKTVRNDKPVLIQQPPPAIYTFRYSITSGKGNWIDTKAWKSGADFNMPLIPIVSEDELSAKTLPPEQSFLSIPGDTLVLTAFKKSDRDNGLVARFYEAAGKPATTSVSFLGKNRTVQPVNMLEESSGGKEQNSLAVGPYSIETVEIPEQSGSPR